MGNAKANTLIQSSNFLDTNFAEGWSQGKIKERFSASHQQYAKRPRKRYVKQYAELGAGGEAN